jgi:hypothetical protein
LIHSLFWTGFSFNHFPNIFDSDIVLSPLRSERTIQRQGWSRWL